MRRPLASLVALGCLVTPALAQAHIQLDAPAPRYVYTGSGQKSGPCGGGELTGMVTDWTAGEQVTVEWTETINHPGHFRIALDTTGGDSFVDPTDENDMTVQGNIVDYIADGGGSTFSHTFTVPDVECDTCTLQLIQVMTDKLGDGWGNNDIYYWCADVRITGGSSSAATTTAASTSATSGAGGSAGTGGSGEGGSASSTGGTYPAPSFGNEDEGGCSMGRGTGSEGAIGALLMALGLVARRRRRS